jgi:hypothetical protein
MANLRLYRDIYVISGSSTYTLINPTSLTANSYPRYSSAITETLTVYNESTGIYYVDLNPILYNFSDIYEVRWNVQYTPSAPNRILITRFRLNPYNIGGANGIEIEIIDNSVCI